MYCIFPSALLTAIILVYVEIQSPFTLYSLKLLSSVYFYNVI